MNNLKRILSLALASVMLVGMMVVGASAKEFTDGETIANTDAVDTLVSLNVIGGYDDGSFRPEGNVTRAQMAKMIAVALHGGDEDFRGSSSGSQFTDVKDGLWYVKFINYCAGEGIINGRDATTFDPEGMVTATETAVMIMRAMGYKNETFLVNGKYSPSAVDKKAEQLGLYNDTTKLSDTSVALNRQNAAQILCNAVQTATPEYQMTYNSDGTSSWTLKNESGDTLLETAYKAKVEFAILDGTTYDAETGKYAYEFDTTGIESKPLDGEAKLAPTTINASELYKHMVRVVYAGKDILGITSVGNNVLGTGVVGSMKEDEDKKGNPTIDGFQFDTGADTAITFNTGDDLDAPNAWDAYTLIDNDGDNKIDCIVINPAVVEKIDGIADGVITTEENGEYTIASEETEEIDTVTKDELAKGDYILVTGKGDATLQTKLAKIEVVENVTATASTTKGVYTIGGQKYLLVDGVSVTLGTAYDLVAVNGYVHVATKHTDGSSSTGVDLSKVAYVTSYAKEAVADQDNLGNPIPNKYSQKVELLFADGTKDIVSMVNLGVKGGSGDDKNDPKPVATDNKISASGLYTYTEKNGKYSLVALTEMEDYTKTAATTEIKDGKQGATRFDDAATIFVAYTNGNGATVAVLTGADVNGWETTTGTLTSSLLFAKKNSTGFNYVALGVIDLGSNNLPGAAATDFMYGYVTSSAVNAWNPDANEGKGATQPQVEIWNGTEKVTYFVTDSDVTAATLTGKSLVKYQLTDGAVSDVEVLTKADLATTVDAYDGANTVVLGNKEFSLKDTVVLYVKEADASGRTNGTIRLASKDKEGNAINNVYAVVEQDAKGNDQLIALFVDVDNKVSEQPKAEEKPTHEHVWTKGDDCKAATCTEDGVKDYWTCEVEGCSLNKAKYDQEGTKTEAKGEVVTDTTISALGHDFALNNHETADDTSDDTHDCSRCDATHDAATTTDGCKVCTPD